MGVGAVIHCCVGDSASRIGAWGIALPHVPPFICLGATILHHLRERRKLFFQYNSSMEKCANARALLWYSSNGVSIFTRGLVPSPEEYAPAIAEQWEAERGQIYAAVKSGDFSYFAGSYAGTTRWDGDIALSKDGVVTGNSITSQKRAINSRKL